GLRRHHHPFSLPLLKNIHASERKFVFISRPAVIISGLGCNQSNIISEKSDLKIIQAYRERNLRGSHSSLALFEGIERCGLIDQPPSWINHGPFGGHHLIP